MRSVTYLCPIFSIANGVVYLINLFWKGLIGSYKGVDERDCAASSWLFLFLLAVVLFLFCIFIVFFSIMGSLKGFFYVDANIKNIYLGILLFSKKLQKYVLFLLVMCWSSSS
jgi:hypothetical protein